MIRDWAPFVYDARHMRLSTLLIVALAELVCGGCRGIAPDPTADAGLEPDAGVLAGGLAGGSAAAGSVAGGGTVVTRTWAAGLPLDTWTALPGTSFMAWANDGGIPRGAYRGTDPFGAIVNAFCDPAVDEGNAFYFYGGGHGDGTCNAVVKFDPGSLRYTLVGAPTPPSVYLPGYVQGGSTAPLQYPSGQPADGWFLPDSLLPNAADAAHRAPALARVSTHMYGAAAMRGSTIHYFYLTYGEFDVASGTWNGRGVDLGAQLPAFRMQYGAVPLQQGTMALYDKMTDRFLVTLNPGDAGGGWRNGIMIFNAATRTIESVHEVPGSLGGPMLNSFNLVQVGRELFVFSKLGNYGQPQVMHQGFIFNIDTKQYKRFVLEGDSAPSTFTSAIVQETIPSFFDGTAIRRWNYAVGQRDKLMTIVPTAVRGTGTATDPLVFQQTLKTLSGSITGTANYEVMFVYKRLIWDEASGCALLLPRAESPWYALRLR